MNNDFFKIRIKPTTRLKIKKSDYFTFIGTVDYFNDPDELIKLKYAMHIKKPVLGLIDKKVDLRSVLPKYDNLKYRIFDIKGSPEKAANQIMEMINESKRINKKTK